MCGMPYKVDVKALVKTGHNKLYPDNTQELLPVPCCLAVGTFWLKHFPLQLLSWALAPNTSGTNLGVTCMERSLCLHLYATLKVIPLYRRVKRNTVHAAQTSRARAVTASTRSNLRCWCYRSGLYTASSSVWSSWVGTALASVTSR